ncbi:MAG: Potassium voltage-gated channel subfamily possible potassium channel, family, partial [Polaromonas sp.]|nr:Potassium voltage-gated channel subfamily possible potassium channel, family [Polaromonas sp.]
MKPSATTRPAAALEKPLEGWRLRWYTVI